MDGTLHRDPNLENFTHISPWKDRLFGVIVALHVRLHVSARLC